MSPDLKTLLHESAPDPSNGPPLDDLRRRAGLRRAVRVGSLGATGVALAVAATALVLNQPADLPVPDVVNPQPSADPSPSATGPVTTPGDGAPQTPATPDSLIEYIAIRGEREIIHHLRGVERTLVTVEGEERFAWGLALELAHTIDHPLGPHVTEVTGVYVASAGESDELWWFRANLETGTTTSHERLPDEFQRRSTGGVMEIGNPAPTIAWAPFGHVLMFVDGQRGVGVDGLDYENRLHVLSLFDDGSHQVVDFPLPNSSEPVTAELLTTCPEYLAGDGPVDGYPLCLLTRWTGAVTQYRLRAHDDGTVEMDGPDDTPIVDGAGNAALSSWTYEDGIERWGIQTDANLEGRGNLLLVNLDEDAEWIELPDTGGEFVRRMSFDGGRVFVELFRDGRARGLIVDVRSGEVTILSALDQELSHLALLPRSEPTQEP